MPLITKVYPKLERAQQSENGDVNARAVEEVYEQYDQDYSDFEEGEEDDVDMDGNSIIHRARPRKLVPDLPQKSQLRASQILENLTIELSALEQAAVDELSKSQVDPHEHYLSSEEEASESADEYDESIIELDMGSEPSSPASRRGSHEDIARVVSFMFVGKPTIIDVLIEKPIQKEHLQRPHNQPRRRPSPLKLTPTITNNYRSTSFIRPTTSRSSSLNALSTINNTQTAPISSTNKAKAAMSSIASKANFLSYDPYPASEAQDMSRSPSAEAMVANSSTNHNNRETTYLEPRTPTHSLAKGAAKDAWKGLNRTLSLAKQRKPSMSSLKTLNMASNGSTTMISPLPPAQSNVQASSGPDSPEHGALTYEEIMRGVIRAPPSPVKSMKHRTGLVSGLMGVGRRTLKA
jgi:hypothetical protein